MIDTHAHIDAEQFDDDRDEMLERAWQAGVEAIVVPSISPSGFDKLQGVVESDERIFRGVGIHPHNANEAGDEQIERVERDVALTRVVAIGEIGLDYYYDFAPKDLQKEVFRKQLKIAKRQNLPVIIHNRESDGDILSILGEEQDGTLKFVLHCFSSSAEILEQALELGAHISFTGNITYKKSILGEVIARTPIERIMIETDSPYMTPVPNRGKRNEPSYVGFVAQKIAEIHSLTIEKVFSMTSHTARDFFRLSLSTFIATILTFGITNISFAQTERDNRESDEEEEIETVNPYSRTFGVGLHFGVNTVVETIECLPSGKRQSRSYEGFSIFGAGLEYCLTDHVQFEASYMYSENTQPVRLGYSVGPNIHQFITLSTRFVANPRRTICFFASAGASVNFNQSSYVGAPPTSNVRNTINGGIGLYGNIATSAGLIVPTAGWNVCFITSSENFAFDPVCNSPSELSRFYSIVQFTVQWYPKF